MSSFSQRHIGLGDADRQHIADLLGYEHPDALIDAALPSAIREPQPLDVGAALTEPEVIAHLRELGARNQPLRTFIGQGYYGTHVPTPILRNVLENPAWYTSYTPYQPEISQGRLEALLNFQTMVADLTGLDIAGASLLDEATAAAEAMALMHRSHRGEGDTLLVDHLTHPQVLEVLRTRTSPLGLRVALIDPLGTVDFTGAFGVILSQPATDGSLRELDGFIATAHEQGLLVTLQVDLLSAVLLRSAGEQGADIAVGSAQRFGVPMAFGGPHAAFIAVRQGLERGLPGRLVGVSVDVHGNRAYRLALQTREQHIRREKATSNICTAQALLAVLASMYAVYHGWEGLREIAARVNSAALRAQAALSEQGWRTRGPALFDTVAFAHPEGAERALELAAARGFNIRRLDDEWAAFSLDETATDSEVDRLLAAIGVDPVVAGTTGLAAKWLRAGSALEHEVFSRYHTETELMRYLRRLADLDLALDRTMIPLGSCTMKLNAATEMLAITWPEFADVHPYVPSAQAAGWLALIAELERELAAVTGYDQVSLQPNAGSQGEFAGLLAITRYHQARGEAQRDVCLIPSSAHGTNAASAVMAGLRVVVVACDEQGNVDLADLRAKIAEYGPTLAAIMLTYPSTHGVYESEVARICDEVHAAGGQVYIDGANLNALVGLARPGSFGSDVSHLNLHKTFAIPHGGGGPGVGPVGVRAHLAPYLPGDPLVAGGGAVSAARYGSAGVLPISYSYIRMMGGEGLTLATKSAVLAANYIARRLGERFPVLYANERGLVAHECILDLRPISKATGVSVDDVAKRLIDFGFHAPTMSFPVAGTLMVEPTESESLAELDRFITAMLAIGEEIAAIERGEVELAQSPLTSAPHTAATLLGGDWPAERRLAAGLPQGVDARSKYWPPVGRIDGAYGDRNLVCSCPPIEELASR